MQLETYGKTYPKVGKTFTFPNTPAGTKAAKLVSQIDEIVASAWDGAVSPELGHLIAQAGYNFGMAINTALVGKLDN